MYCLVFRNGLRRTPVRSLELFFLQNSPFWPSALSISAASGFVRSTSLFFSLRDPDTLLPVVQCLNTVVLYFLSFSSLWWENYSGALNLYIKCHICPVYVTLVQGPANFLRESGSNYFMLVGNTVSVADNQLWVIVWKQQQTICKQMGIIVY